MRREGHFRQTTTLIRYQTRPLPVLETKFEDFESRVLPTPKPQSHALPSLGRNHSHFSSLGAHLSPAKERPVPDPIVTLAHLSSAAENRRAEERPVPDPLFAPKHFPLAEERPVSDPLVTLISHEDAVNAAQAAGRQSVATSDPAVADLPVKMLVPALFPGHSFTNMHTVCARRCAPTSLRTWSVLTKMACRSSCKIELIQRQRLP